MWKTIPTTLLSKRNFLTTEIYTQGKRFLLSNSFPCQEAWERRLQSPIFQNLKLGDLYQDLEQKFQNDGKASAIDIDIFANAVKGESYIDELEDLIHKLRLSANAVYMLPSTSHAFIRTLLAFDRHDDLLRVLNDRLNYGIFPDDYCSCLLMDTYIKQNKFTEATRVSVLQMLQEDWNHPLTTHLALASCHMFLRNKSVWEEESLPEEDSKEEIKVRVKYIRNPYFDDHFDLRNPQLLVGKTLATMGSTLADPVGHTYQLIGWCLYKKWEKVIPLINQLLKSEAKPIIYKEGINMVEDILEGHLKEKPDDSGTELKTSMVPLLEKLKSSGVVCNDDLHAAVMNKVKHIVESEEKHMIEQQTLTYKDWEVTRESALQEEVKKLDTMKRLARVQQEKEELVRREQELFFFDNEDKWDLIIEKKESFALSQQNESKKKKKVQDENYVPPEI
ncbi:small ribosomal subunit protein mS27 [Anabrus simplex]|uniref:small ribosomal subunit protein mS27 n=1 Tax=Anabrus simplex TaxID=316456 RepID=UPI0035A30F10